MTPEFLLHQIEAVLDDLPVAAVKTGMLANAGLVALVGELADGGRLPHLVVDPVMVSTSGQALLDPERGGRVRDLLLPHASLVTPNLAEAAMLTGRDPGDLATPENRVAAATELRALGPTTIVLKGGHQAPGDRATGASDLFVGPDGSVVLSATRVPTGNDHGTGCSLSAAIAANLALGHAPLVAVQRAKEFVHRALEGAAGWHLGAGPGPIDHFGWSGRPAAPVDDEART